MFTSYNKNIGILMEFWIFKYRISKYLSTISDVTFRNGSCCYGNGDNVIYGEDLDNVDI